jgi:ATP-dependent DNA helicase RecG
MRRLRFESETPDLVFFVFRPKLSARPMSATPATDTPLCGLPGIGPARAQALGELGLHSVRDLLLWIPRIETDLPEPIPIATARTRPGQLVRLAVRVVGVSLQRFGGRSTLRLKLRDDSGELTAVYFNQPWLAKHFQVGEALELAGRMVEARGLVLQSPRIGRAEKPLPKAGELLLEYPAVAGLSTSGIQKLLAQLLPRAQALLPELLPGDLRASLALPPLPDAACQMHQPTDLAQFTAARARVRLEALLSLAAAEREREELRLASSTLPVDTGAARLAEVLHALPFELTGGQREVLDAIAADLARKQPMRRLLQGDVGCGKTLVGLAAAMLVARSGGQTAFLAPTELLAEQHFDGQRAMLARFGLHAVCLTGSLKTSERKSVLAGLESGMADIAFGTHALFSADVRYKNLALAVIDEQQRFGVLQRQTLFDKGQGVHALLMTATPIPRTLALALYGDLDTSILRERPRGRGQVSTRWLRGKQREKLPAFLDQRLAAGERVYWVTPRIGEEGEQESVRESGQASAEAARERLAGTALARYGIELVHGRLDAAERSARLQRFRTGAVQILVATTVIEVGVDVPEATVLVVESAERLGLAQLHQLRGRVGRGTQDSWCLLFGDSTARERFAALERTNDGFEISEEDLRQRGMGDLLWVRQAGMGLLEPQAELELLLTARRWCAEREDVLSAYRPHARTATP